MWDPLAQVTACSQSAGSRRPFTVAGRSFGAKGWAFVVACAFAASIARRPTGLLHPNLFAEDGPIFLRTAYLDPAYKSILHPYNGYLHVLMRIWAELTTLMPASALALSYSLFSLAAAPICYSVLLSRRLRWLIPNDALRLLGFALLVVLPGTSEVTGTLTNVLWPVGAAMVLLSLCDPPKSRTGRAAELGTLVVTGLTGATALFAWPAFVWRFGRTRARHDLWAAATVASCAVVQGLAVVTSHQRSGTGLHLDVHSTLQAVLVRTVGVLLLGENTVKALLPGPPSWLLVLCVGAVIVTLLALSQTPRVFQVQWLVLVALILGAVMWAFDGDLTPLADSINAGRYFVLPNVLVVVAWLAAASRIRVAFVPWRVALVAPLAVVCFGVVRDLPLRRLPSTDWAQTADCIRAHESCRVVSNPADTFSFDLPPIPGAH